MQINVVTIFPEFFASPLETSLVGKARGDGSLEVVLHDLRDHGKGVHRQVDDSPFGGGAGMVMMVEPLAAVLDPLAQTHRVLLTPGGRRLDQATLDRWATVGELTLVCGRYEGIDERVAEHFIDEEISLGDYVLLGGEVGALAIIEGIARLLDGVIGNPVSVETESFRDGMLEEPQYTRPAEFRGWTVPEVLRSGDHGKVEEWRLEQRLARTRERRPDLMSRRLPVVGRQPDTEEQSGD
jgi:tRNA (guanine37-N1)-methyltransferase